MASLIASTRTASGWGFESEENYSAYGTVIGIDFGTTSSSVGLVRNGSVEILFNDRGHHRTPSYVAFTDAGSLVGDAAKDQAATNPKRTVYDIKRLMGRNFWDWKAQNSTNRLLYDVVEKDGKPNVKVEINGTLKTFTPEEICSMIIGELKEIAQKYLGENITHAVLSVPDHFNDIQKQSMKDAGTLAGLNILRIISDSSAAALAHGYERVEGERCVLFCDLGGETFDVSLLYVESGIFEVLSTTSDIHLGGAHFSQRVVSYFAEDYNNKFDFDITTDPKAMGKLRRQVEKAKQALSSQMSTRVEVEAFHNGKNFSETLTRTKFEELNHDLFEKTLQLIKDVPKKDCLQNEIDNVILVGGSSYIPKIQALIEEHFGSSKIHKKIDPDKAIVSGTAIQDNYIATNDVDDCFWTMVVNQLSLGIETSGKIMTQLIPRNTVIPTRKSRIFSTVADNQSAILIQIFEGQRIMTKDNSQLGKLELTGIPPAPAGVPDIEVSFELDDIGNLRVNASDKVSGKSETIIIMYEERYNNQEGIEKMLVDAEMHTDEDEALKNCIEAGNCLENSAADLESSNIDCVEGLSSKIDKDSKAVVLKVVEEAPETMSYDSGLFPKAPVLL